MANKNILKIRKKLDKLDNNLLEIIKKRSNLHLVIKKKFKRTLLIKKNFNNIKKYRN